jgi:hypothetical protein
MYHKIYTPPKFLPALGIKLIGKLFVLPLARAAFNLCLMVEPELDDEFNIIDRALSRDDPMADMAAVAADNEDGDSS